jgi:hypothetical protein
MSLSLGKESGSTVFTLSSEGSNFVEHKDLTRALGLPLAIRQTLKSGQPGALGNDHVKIAVSDSRQNSDTGKVSTGSVTLDVSIPRDTAAFDTQAVEDMVCYMRSFLTLTDQEDAIAVGKLNRD